MTSKGFFFFSFMFCAGLGMEPQVLHMLGECSAIGPYPQSVSHIRLVCLVKDPLKPTWHFSPLIALHYLPPFP